MRVFVTGGAGFIGAEVVRQLLERGDAVAVGTRRPLAGGRLAELSHRLAAVDCDLTTAYVDDAKLRAFAPETLLHLGWIGVNGAERNDLAQLKNIVATGALCAAAAAAGARILVGLGSQAEYGCCEGRVDESRPPEPATFYGVAKVAACQILLQFAALHGLRGAWGRLYSIYGPGGDPRTLIPALHASFLAGRAPELTACEQIWEFLHVEDAARAIMALADSERASGVYNIGSGAVATLRAAVTLMRDLYAPGVEPLFGHIPYRPDQVMHLEADVAKIRRDAGWSPRIGLAEGLATLGGLVGDAERERRP
jgi:nucleoside-diphosphate-sugar epimerase